MKLQSLKLYDFRNYAAAGVQLHPGVNLIVGENAQGKTNLLEAVFYLSTGRSFRTARNQELIRFGAEFADLGCELFSGGREQSIRAVLFSGRKPRQLYIGGVKQRSATALPGVLTTVLFCPDDLLVLKSGAAGRRKLVDTALCQLRPGYAQALGEYQKLYESKSRILKDHCDRPSLLEPLPEFNYRMAQVGAILISYRARYLRELSAQAGQFHAEFPAEKRRCGCAIRQSRLSRTRLRRKKRSFSSCWTTSSRITARSWNPASVCPARIRTILKRSWTACPSRPSARRVRRGLRPSA